MQELSTLIARLASAVPARDGVPSPEQREQAVRDAAHDYNGHIAWESIATLTVVANTANYSLPADCVRFVRLAATSTAGGALITSGGIVPVNLSGIEERITIAGTTLTIWPTPTVGGDRDLIYQAGHVLNSQRQYPNLTEAGGSLVLLKAQSLILLLHANKEAHNAMQYSEGEERYSKEQVAKALREQAAAIETRYLDGLRLGSGEARPSGQSASSTRAWGLRARYSR